MTLNDIEVTDTLNVAKNDEIRLSDGSDAM